MTDNDRILINRLQENVHILWHRLTFGASPHVVEEALSDIRDTVAVIEAHHPGKEATTAHKAKPPASE